jgi:hypothetical protein
MAPEAQLTCFADLLALLARDQVPHQVGPEEQTVYVPTSSAAGDGMQLMRWQAGDGILSLVQSTPVEVPPERLGAVEGAVARLNHALPWPGIDLDHERGRVTLRRVLPLAPGVDAEAVRAAFRSGVACAAALQPTLRRVASGALAASDALADAQRELARPASTSTHPID